MYTVQYDARVVDDLASLSKTTQGQVRKAIEKKLTSSPEVFGKPLRQSLLGFRSLRVGDYRVVYIIKKSIVQIFFVGHRSTAYKMIEKRI